MGSLPGRKKSTVATLLAAPLLLSTASWAQPITPGAVLDTLKRPQEVKPAEPLVSPATEAAPRASAAPATVAKTITVERFEFAGNTLFSSDDLNTAVAAYVQRPITLVELYEAADKVTELYVKQGYTLASAIVPAQKVNEGTVRLEVIEGRIGTVRYEGLRRYKTEGLNYFLDTPSGRIYRADGFENKLRLVDGLPGLEVRARLQPGEAYGSSDIVVQARERLVEGVAFFDNGGSENIGIFRGGVQLTLNNPTRTGDQLSLTALRSEGGLLKYGSAAYSLPTGIGASRINLSYAHAEFDIAGVFAGVGGTNRTVRGELFVPYLNTVSDQLNLIAAVNDTRADTTFGGISFNPNQITVLELGGNYTHTFANRGATQVALLVSSNFTGYDATDTASQPLKLDIDVQQLTPLPWYQLQLLTRTQFVYSPEPLPDTQKFSIGGPGTVRGYAPSEARGDWGYLAQITLRRSYLLGPVLATPRIFYDAGITRQHRLDRFPLGSAPQELSLASYGLGGDLGYQSFNFKFDYAVPTTDVPVSDGKEDGRFYGTFSLAF
ncbi:MAG: ShlB/FhaC/HecB family hemolysin secretion/activation protein [Pseudomonadota bacterium]